MKYLAIIGCVFATQIHAHAGDHYYSARDYARDYFGGGNRHSVTYQLDRLNNHFDRVEKQREMEAMAALIHYALQLEAERRASGGSR